MPYADPKLKIDPDCKACGGTGLNSRGNPCGPCQANGRTATEAVRPPEPQETAEDAALDGF